MLAVAIDIETYGACEYARDGTPLPEQTCYHPQKSMHHDGVALKHLILSCAVTLIESEIPCPLTPPGGLVRSSVHTTYGETVRPLQRGTPLLIEPQVSNHQSTDFDESISSSAGSSKLVEWLSSLSPGPSTVFHMDRPEHRKALRVILQRSSVLVGLPFDILNLRVLPGYKPVLSDTQHIIDVSWLNFLQCEVTPERSLKDIGPALGIYRYDEDKTLRSDKRFSSPDDPNFIDYNAQDTHNSIIAIAALADMIVEEFPDSDKLSPYCIQHFSEIAWSVIRMQESGVPMSRSALRALETRQRKLVRRLDALLLKHHGLQITGKGSVLARDAFMEAVYRRIDEQSERLEETLGVPTIYQHPSVMYTKEKHKLCCNNINRAVAAAALPVDDKDARGLRRWTKREEANRVVGSYTYYDTSAA